MSTAFRRIALLLITNLLVFILLAAFLFVAAELYFRLRYPARETMATLVIDPLLGWESSTSLAPFPGNTGEGFQIYFLGDSFVHGKEWPRMTQEILGKRDIKIDGFSLGVSGHGTTQQLVKLEHHLPAQKPWTAVLLFFAWNDMRDNQHFPAIFYSPMHIDRPYLIASGSGWLMHPARISPLLRFFAHSEAHTRVTQRFFLSLFGRLAQNHLDTLMQWHLPVKLYYDEPTAWKPFYDPLKEKESTYVREAYRATEESLRRLESLVESHGGTLFIVGLDNAFTVDQDVYEKAFGSGTTIDTGLPLRRLEEMCWRLGIPCTDLTPVLRALKARQPNRKVFNGPPGNLLAHLEPEGEKALAEVVAGEIGRIIGK